uniref:DUF1618 domain-containing protein n=1 Tax=Triticum urartu TaxID=4572 RepID=A0A8R7TP30_TRIUA
MACVCDHIKLVSLDESGLELSVWTLLTDHSDWIKTSKYNVDKIWANVNYQSTVLRQLIPSLPVLSIHQDGLVYLVVNDESIVDCRLEHKGQYLLRVDMKNNEVQISPQPTRRICYQLFASEFSAYRQHLQDRPRDRSKRVRCEWKDVEDLRCWQHNMWNWYLKSTGDIYCYHYLMLVVIN